MRLLFDQNLSRHLVRHLAVEYPDSRHVTDVGLDTATDAEIWAWAGEHEYMIVSKDSDFRQLAFLHVQAAQPPSRRGVDNDRVDVQAGWRNMHGR